MTEQSTLHAAYHIYEVKYTLRVVVGLRGNQLERRAYHRTASDKKVSLRLKGFLMKHH